MSNLILIPTPITDEGLRDITSHTKSEMNGLRHFVVENVRTARRVLRKYNFTADFDTEVSFFELNKHEKNQSLKEIENWLISKYNVGLMSEAGLPCIADPGNEVVRLAHSLGIKVEVLSGPSSIILALVSSGLNGQNFAFNGYLPIENSERIKKIKVLEQRVISENQTQLFMETPYRNHSLFELLIKSCSPNMSLAIAANVGSDKSIIQSKRIIEWRNVDIPNIHKMPCIFSLGL